MKKNVDPEQAMQPSHIKSRHWGKTCYLVVLMTMLTLIACTHKGEDPHGGASAPRKSTAHSSQERLSSPPSDKFSAQCPKLEDKLFALMNAADPHGFAKKEGIDYRSGFVRVILELSSKRALIPHKYRIQVEGREGRLVQARVRVEELCSLSREAEVVNIRIPVQPTPLRK